MSRKNSSGESIIDTENRLDSSETFLQKDKDTSPQVDRGKRGFLRKTGSLIAIPAIPAMYGLNQFFSLESTRKGLSDSVEPLWTDPSDIWEKMSATGPYRNNIITLLFGTSPAEISLISGKSNPRMPEYQNSNKRLPSMATQDISRLISDSLFSEVEYVDKELSYINNPSISVGGPVVCKAWRQLLGWRLDEISYNRHQFFRETNKFTPELGIYHDIGFEPFQIGEAKSKTKRNWPLIGKIYNTKGELIDKDNFENHLILTYLKDAGNGKPHLNFTGTNASGTWGAIHLFREKHARMIEDVVEAAQMNSPEGWQIIICFGSSYEYNGAGIPRKTAENILDIGVVPL